MVRSQWTKQLLIISGKWWQYSINCLLRVVPTIICGEIKKQLHVLVLGEFIVKVRFSNFYLSQHTSRIWQSPIRRLATYNSKAHPRGHFKPGEQLVGGKEPSGVSPIVCKNWHSWSLGLRTIPGPSYVQGRSGPRCTSDRNDSIHSLNQHFPA